MVWTGFEPASAHLVTVAIGHYQAQDTMGAKLVRAKFVQSGYEQATLVKINVVVKSCRDCDLHEEIPLGWEKLSVLI